HHEHRFQQPLRIVVAGGPKTGRTTLVAALADDACFEGPLSEGDAVLYLTGHPDTDDLSTLRSLHDRAIPTPTIAVLCRADEIGGGRVDAMSSAKLIARRYRTDAEVGALCLDMVAVAGLLARAGRTLTGQDYAALAQLAALGREELDEQVLSADRFVNSGGNAAPRQRLLDRFGLFGVRLATTLIRRGFAEPGRLAAELVRRSGLDDLRAAIDRQFGERMPALKARSVLLAVDSLLRREPRPQARGLLAEIERITLSAQDFRELDLLAALSSGRVELPADLADEAARLLGGHGTELADRLGGDRDGLAAATAALHRWRQHAVNPGFHRPQADAARTVVRTCEGIIDALWT
ncbi:MAG: hypothetical protein JOZ47_02085, partial [Kutzneria sp.]|nr:hypothetical protein [Kutzneria sp.]